MVVVGHHPAVVRDGARLVRQALGAREGALRSYLRPSVRQRMELSARSGSGLARWSCAGLKSLERESGFATHKAERS